MIPALYSDGPLWLVGITWNAGMLAAFLARWIENRKAEGKNWHWTQDI